MGSVVRFVPNDAGFTEFLNSGPVRALLMAEAEGVEARARAKSYAGASYKVDVTEGRSRAHARVSTQNEEAWWSQFPRDGKAPALSRATKVRRKKGGGR